MLKSRLLIELNLLATAGLILCCLYITFVAILRRPLFHPIHSQLSTQNGTQTQAKTTSAPEKPDEADDFGAVFFSIFLLWALALAVGRLFHHLRLPQLLAMLLVGMAFANVAALNNVLEMRASLTSLLRSCAFVLILLRCGIGLNPGVLRRSIKFCSALGLLSTCAEILAIILLSHFLFSVPMPASILFGFVLASTSPAVTVPTMIQLQQRHRGTAKGIPTIALASASIDNIFCISGFAIAYAIAATINNGRENELAHTLIQILAQLIGALMLGCFFGLLLRHVPSSPHQQSRNNNKSLHLCRVLLLLSLSTALFFGSRALGLEVCGPIAVMLSCFVAATAWKQDNPEETRLEAEALRQLWNLLLLPLLFVLIGLLFDFSIFTWKMLAHSLIVILLGVLLRSLVAFGIARANKELSPREALFFAAIFLPKATVQAALAPQLMEFSLASGEDHNSAQFTLQTCILSILLTAPVGQIIIQILGRKCLSNDMKLPVFTAEAAKKSKTGKSSIVKNNGGKMAIDIVVGLPKINAAPDKEASGQSANKSWKENAGKDVEETEEEQQEMEADVFADEENQHQQQSH